MPDAPTQKEVDDLLNAVDSGAECRTAYRAVTRALLDTRSELGPMKNESIDEVDAMFSNAPLPQSPLGIESRQFWEE